MYDVELMGLMKLVGKKKFDYLNYYSAPEYSHSVSFDRSDFVEIVHDTINLIFWNFEIHSEKTYRDVSVMVIPSIHSLSFVVMMFLFDLTA